MLVLLVEGKGEGGESVSVVGGEDGECVSVAGEGDGECLSILIEGDNVSTNVSNERRLRKC